VLRFNLDGLAPPVAEAVWTAAIPHWFDIEFLSTLLGVQVSAELFRRVTGLSFVEIFSDRGHNVHERSRDLLLDHLWKRNSDRFRQLSIRAAEYCAKRDKTDIAWRIEEIYHLLVADPDRGIAAMHASCREWFGPPSFAEDKVEAMVRAAAEHGDAERLPKRAKNWIAFWKKRLDITYGKADQAELSALKPAASDDPLLAAEIALASAEAYRRDNDYAAALPIYRTALEQFSQSGDRLGAAEAELGIGHSVLPIQGFDAARPHFEEASRQYRQAGHTIRREELSRFANRERLLLDNLSLLENISALTARRFRMDPVEAEDFTSLVKLKMIEDDYRILRRYGGLSKLSSYLSTVVARLAIDYVENLASRWRPSAEARRLGPTALRIEELLVRDGLSLDEAIEILIANEKVAISRDELAAMAARLPARAAHTHASEAVLRSMAAEDGITDRELAKNDALDRVLSVLRRVIDGLPQEDRLIITMLRDTTIPEMARVLNTDQKKLYRRKNRLLDQLRASMEKEGIRSADVAELLSGL
jgi:DNA-directed RNA polymerase specialized sigma24 family protein